MMAVTKTAAPIAALLCVLLIFASSSVWGIENSTIDATVKIGVCGNELAETTAGEECDNSDLNSKTCQSFGFAQGELWCRSDCSFSTASCSGVLATPTPSPTTVSAPTPSPAISSVLQNQQESGALTELSLTPSASPIVYDGLAKQISLPSYLQLFDEDGDGRIGSRDLYIVIKTWVTAWRKTSEDTKEGCDLNSDNTCDLIDLSVILYHIDR